MALGIALRSVLEALRKSPVQNPAGKMFKIGMPLKSQISEFGFERWANESAAF